LPKGSPFENTNHTREDVPQMKKTLSFLMAMLLLAASALTVLPVSAEATNRFIQQTDFEYDFISDFIEEVAFATKGKTIGLLNRNGVFKPLGEYEFDSLRAGWKYSGVNPYIELTKGEQVSYLLLDGFVVNDVGYSEYPNVIPFLQNEEWADYNYKISKTLDFELLCRPYYFDYTKGVWASETLFFDEYIAIARKNEKIGIVDLRSADVVVPFEYDDYKYSRGAIGYFLSQGKWKSYDFAKKQWLSDIYDSVESQGSKLILGQNGKFGLYAYQKLLSCEYSSIDVASFESTSDETAIYIQVVKNGMRDCLSYDFAVLFSLPANTAYDKVTSISKYDFGYGEITYAVIEKSGKYGVAYKDGKIIVPCTYEKMDLSPLKMTFDGSTVTCVRANTKLGSENKDIYIAKDMVFDGYGKIGDGSVGVMSFKMGDKYGAINAKHEIVIPFESVYGDYRVFTVDPDDHDSLLRVFPTGFHNQKGELVISYDGLAWLPGYFDEDHPEKGKYILPNPQVHNNPGIYTIKGERLIKFNEYSNISPWGFSKGLICVVKDGKYGYADHTGELVIDCKYDYGNDVKYGYASVKEQSGKYALIDTSGRKIYENDNNISDGLNGSYYYISGGKMNIIDLQNPQKPVIRPFDDNSSLNGGGVSNSLLFSNFACQLVSLNGKWGALGLHGKETIPCDYDKIERIGKSDSKQGFVKVFKGGKVGVYEHAGRCILKCEYDTIDQDYSLDFFTVKQGAKNGIAFNDGTVFFDAERVGSIQDRVDYTWYQILKKDGKCGVVRDGKLLMGFEYDEIDERWINIRDRKEYHLKKNGLLGRMLDNLDIVIPCEYKTIENIYLDGGKHDLYYRVINSRDKVGLIDLQNYKTTIPCIYDGLEWFHGHFIAQLNGKYGIIDYDGKTILPCEYDSIDYIYNPYFSNIYAVKKNGLYGLVKNDGSALLNCEHDMLGTFVDMEGEGGPWILFYTGESPYIWLSKNDKFGLIDANCDVVIPYEYDSMDCGDDYAIAGKKIDGAMKYALYTAVVRPSAPGDANGDGVVNIEDILLIRDVIFGLAELSKEGYLSLGLNENDAVTINSILYVRDVIFGIES